MLLTELGVTVVAASVDSLDKTRDLATGLRIRYVQMLAELDGPAVAKSTGALLQDGDKPFLHATGFLLGPDGNIVNAVYSSGPIGRFTGSEVLRKTIFEQAKADG